jgi:hypothetical protein
VHTLALPVRDSLGQVFRGVDLEAQLCLLATDLAAKVRRLTPLRNICSLEFLTVCMPACSGLTEVAPAFGTNLQAAS